MSLRVSKPEFNIREKLNELDRPVGAQGNNILQSNTTAESFSKIQAGRRNLLINGNMSIAQRGSSTTGITGDTFGACDRWELDLAGAGTWTMEQVGDAPYNTGFTHCSSLSCTSAATTVSSHLIFRQKIEACHVKSLAGGNPNAKPLTLSFWVKSNEPGKYYAIVYRQRAGTDTSRISISYTIEQSEVWEFKTITYPPDTLDGYQTTETTQGLEVHFALGLNQNNYGSAHYGQWSTNSAYVGKGQTNLAAATGNYWRITGVQLEVGSEHTEFQDRSHTEELALCYRYYRRFTPVAPSGTDNYCGFGIGIVNQISGGIWTFPLDIPMRDRPAITQNNLRLYDGSTNANITAMNTNRSSTTAIWIEPTTGSNSFTNGRAFLIGGNNTAGGYVEFDAEL